MALLSSSRTKLCILAACLTAGRQVVMSCHHADTQSSGGSGKMIVGKGTEMDSRLGDLLYGLH